MIETKLDKPPDKEVKCLLCGGSLKVTHYWFDIINRWVAPSCHERCVETWTAQRRAKGAVVHEIPPRFREFNLELLPDQQAARLAGNFNPQSEYQTLAIIGHGGLGKSRLMWQVVRQFFSDLGVGWVEYAMFPELMLEPDKAVILKLKSARYVFIDDVGSTESYGRERAHLQDVIRTRVQKGHWTFLTIDDPAFDAGFEDLFRDRAEVIYVK